MDSLETFLSQAGPFVYPLGLFSLLGLLVTFERLIALRSSAVLPGYLRTAVMGGGFPEPREGDSSVAAEILRFHHDHQPDESSFRAFAGIQVNRLERGLFLLDIVVSGAPLVGLLGTVTGLVGVFGTFSTSGGLPEPEQFVEGISLALTTTILGLAIAIPALVASGFLARRVENHAALISLVVERLLGSPKETSGG